MCPDCEQYNGFTNDGDYNRDMFQQFNCSNKSVGIARLDQSSTERDTSVSALSATKNNGLCHECNEAQRLKVEKLAQFEPKSESRFDAELHCYKSKLEEQYRLCGTCERHLRKVLHEKKKIVLGSKFLDFIIKGAETLKQPHFNHIRQVQRQLWKRRLSLHITILTIINLICLCYMLPTLKREHITTVLGDRFGEQLFFAMSHVLALARVFTTYISEISAYPLLEKLKLFIRTIFMMLLYSLGLKFPKIARINFSALYVLVYPFTLLVMTFGYKLIDGFKLTRFTFLLALWSAFAGGLIEEQLYFPPNVLLLIASALTLLLSVTNEVEISPKLHDNSANSFHKIYSEDYLSDDDTISMLSQHFNCSDASTVRCTSIRGGEDTSLQKSLLYKSPLTSSTYSINNMPRTQFSPNSSFKSCYFDAQTNSHSKQSLYAPSVGGVFNTDNTAGTIFSRPPYFASNLELNSSYYQRPRSTMFGQSETYNGNVSANASLLRTSFNGEPYNQYLPNQHNTSFSQYRASCSSANRPQFSVHSATLNSPFSLSTNSIYQQQQHARPSSATNLLTPSRFSTSCLTGNVYSAVSPATTVSWLAGGALNHTNKIFPETRQPMMSTIGENKSRASSQSSGFESQNDRLNASRESSFNTANESLDLTAQQGNTYDATTPRAFQPIHDAHSSHTAYKTRPSLLSHNTQLVTPLTVNCGMASVLSGPALSDLWGAPAQRKSISSHDSFNLRKITEELPVPCYKYKRGDLLKKWKESQMIS
ncbi:uncharacterized protein [Eurosta solidaginis]